MGTGLQIPTRVDVSKILKELLGQKPDDSEGIDTKKLQELLDSGLGEACLDVNYKTAAANAHTPTSRVIKSTFIRSILDGRGSSAIKLHASQLKSSAHYNVCTLLDGALRKSTKGKLAFINQNKLRLEADAFDRDLPSGSNEQINRHKLKPGHYFVCELIQDAPGITEIPDTGKVASDSTATDNAVFKIGMLDYFPLSWKDGNKKGVMDLLLDRAWSRLKTTVEKNVKSVDIVEGINQVMDGTLDCIFGLFQTPNRIRLGTARFARDLRSANSSVRPTGTYGSVLRFVGFTHLVPIVAVARKDACVESVADLLKMREISVIKNEAGWECVGEILGVPVGDSDFYPFNKDVTPLPEVDPRQKADMTRVFDSIELDENNERVVVVNAMTVRRYELSKRESNRKLNKKSGRPKTEIKVMRPWLAVCPQALLFHANCFETNPLCKELVSETIRARNDPEFRQQEAELLADYNDCVFPIMHPEGKESPKPLKKR